LLGSAFTKAATKEHDVYSLYNQHVPLHGVPIQLNMLQHGQLAKVLREIRPEAIIHCAALTDVDQCERQRELAMAVNCSATSAIARVARELGAFVVYLSTDYVFDGEKGMYNEADRPNPVNYYGLTKLRGEEAIREQLADHLIARTSVIYGSTPASGKANFALWLLDKLRSGQPVPILADQYVSPTLNSNLAEMILEGTERRKAGTFHFAGADRVSRYEFAQSVCREWRLDSSLLVRASFREMKWLAARPKDSSLDVSKARASLAKRPMTVPESLKALRHEMEKGA